MLAAAVFLTSSPAEGQELSVRVLGASAYVWRGLTVTSRPVLQPSLDLTLGSERAALRLSAWGNVEPAAYDGVDDISESEGEPGLTELDFYAELSGTLGPASLTAGVAAYTYPNESGYIPADNTVEVYAGAELDVPLTPSLHYYHDVDEISGGYVELALGREVTFGPRSTRMGVAVGYSLSQAPDYFAENGFTHVDLSAASELSLGPVSLEPELHLIVHLDDATRQVTPLRERDTRVWFGLGISWTGPIR